MENIRICTYDAVFGFVDYGETKYNSNKIDWITKERCKVCGAAWIAENYLDGHSTCPNCGTNDPNNILHIR